MRHVHLTTFACMNEDNCKSVHVDGEACVIGIDDVTAFEEGELVTSDLTQVLKLKGKAFEDNLFFY